MPVRHAAGRIIRGMPTPAERKALLFLALVAALGAGVRLSRASTRHPEPTLGERLALSAQRAAVDSALRAERGDSRAQGATRGGTRRAARDSAPLDGRAAVRRSARSGKGPGVARGAPIVERFGEPVLPDRQAPGHTVIESSRAGRASRAGASARVVDDARPVDVDQATVEEIERLPWVGPALARRIVANRDSFGAFGGVAALGEVRGIGPALLERIRGRVTFSASPRPLRASSRARR